MAEAVYLLCFLTSLACAVLLMRGYVKTRASMLLWCALCFVGLAVNNLLLYFDMVILPTMDLSVWRSATALLSVLLLVYGLVWGGE